MTNSTQRRSSRARRAALPIALALALAPVVASTITPPAAAGVSDLTIISPKTVKRGLYICENWTAKTGTASTCTSGVDGYLLPGQNSRVKYGKADFDGIRVDAGWSLRKSNDSKVGDGDDHTVAGCRAKNFWKKVSPSIADPGENEDWYYLWNCPAF